MERAAAAARLLNAERLPSTLWDGRGAVMVMPPLLAGAYLAVIDAHCRLAELASAWDRKDPPTGGASQERADQYFAQAYPRAVAQAQLAMLDPCGKLHTVSDALVRAFCGGAVCVVDAPCGSGAASLAFLTCVAELRESGVLPREPLAVRLIGADISEPAMAYARELLERLQPGLKEQGITLEPQWLAWNITDKMQTTQLNEHLQPAQSSNTPLLMVSANFSNFLHNNFNASRGQLEEIYRYASRQRSLALWLEPQTNEAIGHSGVLPKIVGLVEQSCSKWAHVCPGPRPGEQILKAECGYHHPLNDAKPLRCRLAVISIDLERMK